MSKKSIINPPLPCSDNSAPCAVSGVLAGRYTNCDAMPAPVPALPATGAPATVSLGKHIRPWPAPTPGERSMLNAAWDIPGEPRLAFSLVGAPVIGMPGLAAQAHRAQATGVLLEQPSSTPQPMHSTVYGLKAGRVGVAPLARYRLPAGVLGHLVVMPFDISGSAVSGLPMLAEMAERIAPWVTVHAVPRVLTKLHPETNDYGSWLKKWHIGGEDYAECGGLACTSENLVLISLNNPHNIASTLAHELMHMLWRYNLNDRSRAILTAAVADGYDWQGSYMSSVEERVCRAFQSYASARLEGLPAAEMVMDMPGIFEMCWSGTLADRLIEMGTVHGAEALRARRGLVARIEVSQAQVDEPIELGWMDQVTLAAWRGLAGACRWAWNSVAAQRQAHA